jgi:integrase
MNPNWESEMRAIRMLDQERYVRVVRGRYQVKIDVPAALKPIIGKGALTRFIQTDHDYTRAVREFGDDLAEARRILRGEPEPRYHHREGMGSPRICLYPQSDRFIANVRVPIDFDLADHLRRTVRMNDSRVPYTIEAAITAWTVGRKVPPKPKAIRNKRARLVELFTFLGRPDDLTSLTPEDLQGYKEHLLAKGGNDLAHYHLSDVRTLVNVAFDEGKFGRGVPNPASLIKTPPKRSNGIRPAFTDDEARRIALAVADAPPWIKWPTLLAAALGTIAEETVDADVRDVERVGDMIVLHIRPDHRVIIGADANNLKSVYRKRSLPLPRWLAEPFADYAESVWAEYGPGPLFPQVTPDRDGIRSNRVGHLIRRFTRDLGIDGTPYSWRKRFATALEGMADLKPDRQCYLTGHGPIDVHAKFYLEHPPAETFVFIDRIPDPAAAA